jgi:D-3-phosphoglycerate dehydrogenase
MARIQTFNKIAPEGLAILTERGHEVGPDVPNPDGILVRSAKLHDLDLGDNLKAIARAGAGVNNVPVDRCTDAGVVVFNTPGSNANSVKELVIAGLMLSSRRIIEACEWVQTLDRDDVDVAKEVEAGKSAFAGPEIAGKTLGVIGLGAIGVMVANAAEALGMRVIGFDPFLSVESAWGLSRSVERAQSLEALVGDADYLTIHAPLTDGTKGLINTELLARARPGLRVLNFARGALADNDAILSALASGQLSRYVTDFPDRSMVGVEGVIAIPHLGASTPEAETNSAIMAAQQLAEYLERGNIRNSVNFPGCELGTIEGRRIVLANRNVPNMVGQITTILAGAQLNISNMINRHRGELAYNIIDVEGDATETVIAQLRAIDGVIGARLVGGAS